VGFEPRTRLSGGSSQLRGRHPSLDGQRRKRLVDVLVAGRELGVIILSTSEDIIRRYSSLSHAELA
jgi:hypothetical protein